jgi:hypothetical protein
MPTGINRWGTVEWGGSAAVPGSGLVLDVAASYADAIYRLGFGSVQELTSVSWVTGAELYQWADEAVKRLAYLSGVFLTEDVSLTLVPGTAVYALPASHVFTIAAWFNGSPLRATAVRDLWALDATWPTTSGSPTRFSEDAGSVGTITIYASPIVGGALALIAQEFPAAIVAGASALELPTVLQDYFTDAMIAGARGKESEAAMLDVASHLQERMKLYEAVIDHLYGSGS